LLVGMGNVVSWRGGKYFAQGTPFFIFSQLKINLIIKRNKHPVVHL
jgi:hypothetical protein